MHFTINTKELQKAVSFAGKAVMSSAITPIFECILMEAKSTGVLVLTGSDTNTTLSTRANMSEWELDGADSVKIAAPLDILSATLATLPDTGITITYIHDGKFSFNMVIEQETNQFRLACEDPTTYLKMPQMPQSESVVIPAQLLQRGIDQVLHCVSSDAMRPGMCGVNIEIENGLAEFTATDGQCLAHYRVDYPNQDLVRKMNIPARFASMVSELVGDDQSDIELKVSDRFVRVLIGDWAAYGTLIEASFPTWKPAMPTEFKFAANINAESFKTLLKRAQIYANQKTFTVSCSFRDNIMLVVSENTDKNMNANQDMSIESEIEDFEIGFNKKMLDKVLKTVSGDFDLYMNAENMAAIIEPAADEGEKTQYLLMPVVLPTSVHYAAMLAKSEAE